MTNELFKRVISSIILLPIILFLVVKGSIYFNTFLLISFFLTILEWNKICSQKIKLYAGSIFIIISFLTTYMVRNILNNEYFIFMFILGICIATDIGGYVFGKFIKGPKLTKISPNKTYSGMIGSFILTLVFIYFFSLNISIQHKYTFSLDMIIFSILVSAISQLGDLTISYFKRISKIKDTGSIIPGHGGILDRIDGMLFAFPFSYFLISINFLNLF